MSRKRKLAIAIVVLFAALVVIGSLGPDKETEPNVGGMADQDGKTKPITTLDALLVPGDHPAEVMQLGNSLPLAFEPVGKAVLTVSVDQSDFVLTTGETWRFFDTLEVRIAQDGSRARTAVGDLTERSEIVGSAAQQVTGPWSGTCWKLEDTAGGGARFINLCVGRFHDRDRNILYYEARSTTDRSPASHSDFALYFDP